MTAVLSGHLARERLLRSITSSESCVRGILLSEIGSCHGIRPRLDNLSFSVNCEIVMLAVDAHENSIVNAQIASPQEVIFESPIQ